MKYLQTEAYIGNNECSGDAIEPAKLAVLRVDELSEQIDSLAPGTAVNDRLRLVLDRCYVLLELNRFEEAWAIARESLDQALENELWLRAVESCDIMFQSDQPESVKALAHGIWLGVTFPVDPELSVAMLQHLVDESPDRSDGAAVAAATACYVVDLRAEGKQREDLLFFTNQILGQVARKHSQVEEQEIFDFWVQQLELDDPQKFLPRLSKVLEVLIGDSWWYDRSELREKIPA
jgi:hypothetical protein